MKVLTLNTHSWLEENQQDKMERLAQKIHDEQFDVIALQEVNQTAKANIVASPFGFCKTQMTTDIKEDNFALKLVTYLHEKFNDDYQWTWSYNHIGYDIYDEGTALLSRHPITSPFSYRLSEIDDPKDYHTRYATGACIKVDGQVQYFMSLHASWWLSPEGNLTFPYEANRLNELKDKLEYPIMIMGDFNNPSQKRDEGYDLITQTWNDSYTSAKETLGQYTMGGAIAGWEKDTPPLRIDFIFTSNTITINKAVICFDGHDQAPISDHFGYYIITD